MNRTINIKKIEIKDITCEYGTLVGITKKRTLDMMSWYGVDYYTIKKQLNDGKIIKYRLSSLDSKYYEDDLLFDDLNQLKEKLIWKNAEVWEYINDDDCFLFVSKTYLFVNSFLENIKDSEKKKLNEILSGELK